MVFSEFVQMLHRYVTSENSQQEAVSALFFLLMKDPESEEDLKLDAKDEYYPYSKKTMASSARKVYSGTDGRTIPPDLAGFVIAHFNSDKFLERMEDVDDEPLQELSDKLIGYGYDCTPHDVAYTCVLAFRDILRECEKKKTTRQKRKKTTVSDKPLDDTEYGDLPLLSEVNNECPICHAPLVKTVKGISKPKYGIVRIFPPDLSAEDRTDYELIAKPPKNYESNDNKIALCTDHAEEYEMEPDTEEFSNLLQLKKQYSESYRMRLRIASQDLEEEIQDVIFALTDLPSSAELVELSMSALKVAVKIPDQHGVLQNDVEKDVLKYYQFIEDQFSIAGNFSLIASEVSKTYELLAQDPDKSQEAIFVELMHWILSSRNLEPKHLLAARLVVSFFVQNCEVFEPYEISG